MLWGFVLIAAGFLIGMFGTAWSMSKVMAEAAQSPVATGPQVDSAEMQSAIQSSRRWTTFGHWVSCGGLIAVLVACVASHRRPRTIWDVRGLTRKPRPHGPIGAFVAWFAVDPIERSFVLALLAALAGFIGFIFGNPLFQLLR